MSHYDKLRREHLIWRVLWMVVFFFVWQVAELLLLALVIYQLGYRLLKGTPNLGALAFGDSLSQYLAHIGRFGTFSTEDKPWPFADWPTPRLDDASRVEPPAPVAPQP